jgi:hypothetical protein
MLTTQSIHILQPRKSARRPKLQKEYAFLLPEKNCLKKIPSLLKNFKNAISLSTDRQKRTLTITAKLNTDNGCKIRGTRTPACNTGYKQAGGQCFNKLYYFLFTFVAGDNDGAFNARLLIARNR